MCGVRKIIEHRKRVPKVPQCVLHWYNAFWTMKVCDYQGFGIRRPPFWRMKKLLEKRSRYPASASSAIPVAKSRESARAVTVNPKPETSNKP